MFGVPGSDKAFNGKEALEVIMNNQATPKCHLLTGHKPYIAIFLDLNMPLLNGYETA